jgi:AAA+ ATPase superfamily predicted ATPase
MFVGRECELNRLANLWKRKTASFVVVKGRRRIGKSRLIEEFAKNANFISLSGLAPSEAMTAQMQRDEFARQLARIFQIPIPYSKDWGDLFWHLAHHTHTKKVVILLDEISWMGMKDPTFLGNLKNSWDQHLKKNPQLILIVCGSVSSWIEKNILSSTGFVGRVDLVFNLEELSLHDCNKFWGIQEKNISSYEKFKILSVTGGVPKYLEGITPNISAEEFIRQSCFTAEGFLFREFDNIFNDLFSKKSDIYRRILKCLVDRSMATLDLIVHDIQVTKSGVYSDYMYDLQMAGFVSSHHTWNLKDAKTSKLVQFRLSDNYIRFYLKYIEPNKEKIQRGFFQDRSLATLPGFDSIMGLQFENLVIKNRKILFKILGVHSTEIINDGSYFQKSGKIKTGCQIDYMIQSKFNALHLCEVKFSKNPIGISIIEEVQRKITALNASKSMSIRPILIHVNGVDDAVYGEEFFADIIDFGQFLKEPI